MSQQNNNQITPDQWEQIVASAETSRIAYNEPPNALYIKTNKTNGRTRHFVYDNYDRFYMPGLDYIVEGEQDIGNLYVYNSSEQARAPVTFEQGLQIARNFFNEYGSQMSEEIVCEWVMDGNNSIF